MIKLREYQKEAVNATINYIRKNSAPCLLEMSVGAGKSLCIAAIANTIHRNIPGKKVLCLVHRTKLVIQNHKQYVALTQSPASIFCASAGHDNLRHPVIFATPQSFKKVADRLAGDIITIIIDECEGMPKTVRQIIDKVKAKSPNCRIIGTTGTAFTPGNGYIFREDETGKVYSEEEAKKPYFAKRVYSILTHQLLEMGFLTPMVIGETGSDKYDTDKLELLPNSVNYTSASLDAVFIGDGRKTAHICADMMARFRDRKSIVIFASTIQHAHEVLASLPRATSAIVTGDMSNSERERTFARFNSGVLRVLINVDLLTVGWDCPRVDAIALLRATQSARLLIQMLGRGLRLFPGKKDVLLLDYAQNIERHAPDGNIFKPQIQAGMKKKIAGRVKAVCPTCNTENEFPSKPNEKGYQIDRNGYFRDAGQLIDTEFGPEPAHFGRRCRGFVEARGGDLEQCSYRWTFKTCPACNTDNDITARRCVSCKVELINPNDRLIFKDYKEDLSQVQTEVVVDMRVAERVSKAGNQTLMVTFTTDYRRVVVWFTPSNRNSQHQAALRRFNSVTQEGEHAPETISYFKEGDFYRIVDYNKKPDTIKSVVRKTA